MNKTSRWSKERKPWKLTNKKSKINNVLSKSKNYLHYLTYTDNYNILLVYYQPRHDCIESNIPPRPTLNFLEPKNKSQRHILNNFPAVQEQYHNFQLLCTLESIPIIKFDSTIDQINLRNKIWMYISETYISEQIRNEIHVNTLSNVKTERCT